MGLITDARLAEEFGISLEKLHTLRKRHHWPCVKLGRFEYRFTPDQVEHIVALHTDVPKAPSSERAAPVSIAGQTKRSASRARAG